MLSDDLLNTNWWCIR